MYKNYVLELIAEIEKRMSQNLSFMGSYEVVDQVSSFFFYLSFFQCKYKTFFCKTLYVFLQALSRVQPDLKEFLEHKNIKLMYKSSDESKIIEQYNQIRVENQTHLS